MDDGRGKLHIAVALPRELFDRLEGQVHQLLDDLCDVEVVHEFGKAVAGHTGIGEQTVSLSPADYVHRLTAPLATQLPVRLANLVERRQACAGQPAQAFLVVRGDAPSSEPHLIVPAPWATDGIWLGYHLPGILCWAWQQLEREGAGRACAEWDPNTQQWRAWRNGDYGPLPAEAVLKALTEAKRSVVLPALEAGEISRGRAAELLGISMWDMLDLMSQHGIPHTDLSLEELREELAPLSESEE
jgi:predicted HTH domain antitoxin